MASDDEPRFKTIIALTLVTTIEPGGTSFEPIRRLLYYSWKPINFHYDQLTAQEKSAISRIDFEILVPWVMSASLDRAGM